VVQVNVAFLVLGGVALLAAGLLVGLAVGRMRGQSARRKVLELEMELKQARETQAAFRDKVADHFGKTSDLVQVLTFQFRDVYEHLAEGARELCPDRLPPLGRGSMEDVLLTEVAGTAHTDAGEDDDLGLPPSRLAEADADAAAEDDEPGGLESVLSDEPDVDSPELGYGMDDEDEPVESTATSAPIPEAGPEAVPDAPDDEDADTMPPDRR